MTLEELRVQIALGTVPESLRLPLLQGFPKVKKPTKHKQRCMLCQRPLIKGEEYFRVVFSQDQLIICDGCSYISIVSACHLCKDEDK